MWDRDRAVQICDDPAFVDWFESVDADGFASTDRGDWQLALWLSTDDWTLRRVLQALALTMLPRVCDDDVPLLAAVWHGERLSRAHTDADGGAVVLYEHSVRPSVDQLCSDRPVAELAREYRELAVVVTDLASNWSDQPDTPYRRLDREPSPEEWRELVGAMEVADRARHGFVPRWPGRGWAVGVWTAAALVMFVASSFGSATGNLEAGILMTIIACFANMATLVPSRRVRRMWSVDDLKPLVHRLVNAVVFPMVFLGIGIAMEDGAVARTLWGVGVEGSVAEAADHPEADWFVFDDAGVITEQKHLVYADDAVHLFAPIAPEVSGGPVHAWAFCLGVSKRRGCEAAWSGPATGGIRSTRSHVAERHLSEVEEAIGRTGVAGAPILEWVPDPRGFLKRAAQRAALAAVAVWLLGVLSIAWMGRRVRKHNARLFEARRRSP